MRTVVLASLLALTGCFATIQVGPHELNKEVYEGDVADIKSRASFELRCAPEQLELTILTVGQGYATWVTQMGVAGCGQRVVYVRQAAPGYRGVWVLNSSSHSQQSSL
jgi:hypothetical protein